MKKFVTYLVFFLIAGGLVAFVYKDRIFPREAVEREAGPDGGRGGMGRGFRRRPDIVPVLVEKAKTAAVPVHLVGVGTVQAYNTATVRAQVSGRLIEVNFKEGQDVKAGDVLARLDPAIYQAAYDQAVAKKAMDEAMLNNARLDEKRYTSLAKSDYSSQQQADTAQATVRQHEGQVRQDQAAIDNARANLNYTTIRSPFDGRTGLRLVDVGNLVSSQDATGIVVITQLQPISVVFTLPENQISEVLAAQAKEKLPLTATANGQSLGEGQLEVIDNQIDQATGTFKLKGTFPNQDFKLWPGQYVNVTLRLKVLEDAIVVPSVAIQQGASGSFVYRVTPENTVRLVDVKVLQEGEQTAVITEGVSPGDTLVTSGFANLTDGSKVRIDTQEAPAGASDAGRRRSSSQAEGGASERRKERRKDAESGNGGSVVTPAQASPSNPPMKAP